MGISKKIKIIYITLHVNGGTFIPIRTANVFKHKMHYEYGCISKKSSEEIAKVTGGLNLPPDFKLPF